MNEWLYLEESEALNDLLLNLNIPTLPKFIFLSIPETILLT